MRVALIDALRTSLLKQFGENPKHSDDYGRIINARHFNRIQSYLIDHTNKVQIGGESDELENYIAPTVILNPELDSPLMTDEIFGPLLPVIEVDTMAQAVDLVNEREKPLALYLFSNNQNTIDMVKTQTSSGTLCINDAVIFMVNHNMPFGGVGNSGMGCYHGKWGFDTFSHLKPIMHRSFFADVPIRYAPFNKLKATLIKWATKL